MDTCSWCKARTDKTVKFMGETICNVCNESVSKGVCRKCGATKIFDPDMTLRGLCLDCLQLEEIEKTKRREEVKLGLDSYYQSPDTVFTEEDYERWLTFNPNNSSGFSPKEFKESSVLRRFWIMMKLRIAGVHNEEIINNNMDDLEELLNENISKLLYNKCRFVIINNMKERKELSGKQIIAQRGKIYIVKV